ncbi:MAG: hypothetical protein ACK4M7_01065, partial [Burkholderiales bacterium]
WGTNYTNHAERFRQFIDNSLEDILNKSNLYNKEWELLIHKNPNKGQLLAHIVNFITGEKKGDISELKLELAAIKKVLNEYNPSTTFGKVSQLGSNEIRLFPKWLPNYIRQAIMELKNSDDSKQCEDFLKCLSQISVSFLEKNGIDISAFIPIRDDSDISSNSRVREPSTDLGLLEKSDTQLSINVHDALIESCSSTELKGNISNQSNALKLSEKADEQLVQTTLQELEDLAKKYAKYAPRVGRAWPLQPATSNYTLMLDSNRDNNLRRVIEDIVIDEEKLGQYQKTLEAIISMFDNADKYSTIYSSINSKIIRNIINKYSNHNTNQIHKARLYINIKNNNFKILNNSSDTDKDLGRNHYIFNLSIINDETSSSIIIDPNSRHLLLNGAEGNWTEILTTSGAERSFKLAIKIKYNHRTQVNKFEVVMKWSKKSYAQKRINNHPEVFLGVSLSNKKAREEFIKTAKEKSNLDIAIDKFYRDAIERPDPKFENILYNPLNNKVSQIDIDSYLGFSNIKMFFTMLASLDLVNLRNFPFARELMRTHYQLESSHLDSSKPKDKNVLKSLLNKLSRFKLIDGNISLYINPRFNVINEFKDDLVIDATNRNIIFIDCLGNILRWRSPSCCSQDQIIFIKEEINLSNLSNYIELKSLIDHVPPRWFNEESKIELTLDKYCSDFLKKSEILNELKDLVVGEKQSDSELIKKIIPFLYPYLDKNFRILVEIFNHPYKSSSYEKLIGLEMALTLYSEAGINFTEYGPQQLIKGVLTEYGIPKNLFTK